MLFKPEHIPMIIQGKKVATRRDWKRWQVKEGGVYAVQTEMFQEKEEAPCLIKVKDRYRQKLKNMTPEDADKEGGYTLEEFKEKWREINGWWKPEFNAHVVEFELEKVQKYKGMEEVNAEEIDWDDVESLICNKTVFLYLLENSDFYPEELVEDADDILDDDVVVKVSFGEDGSITYTMSNCFAHFGDGDE